MAVWAGLGQAATVAQLLGADLGGLVSSIVRAATTARQNRAECSDLADRVLLIGELLHQVQQDPDPAAVRHLAGLGGALRDARDLIVSCQGRSKLYQFVKATKIAENFSEVQKRIDFYLLLFPMMSHIRVTRRIDKIYNTITRIQPPLSSSEWSELQDIYEDVRALANGRHEFKRSELLTATRDFALDNKIKHSIPPRMVYRGKLVDGRWVAVLRVSYCKGEYTEMAVRPFRQEVYLNSRLQNQQQESMVKFLGWSVAEGNDNINPHTEALLVYDYMDNDSVFEQLHSPSSSHSPIMISWKSRVDLLLSISRAVEHLHCRANKPVAHRYINTKTILLNSSWVPQLCDLGLSVEIDERDPAGLELDIRAFGFVMLEVLTGKPPEFWSGKKGDKKRTDLVSWALPLINEGKISKLLDNRVVAKPSQGQLRALDHVAQTAAFLLREATDQLPTLSTIVAKLEIALMLISIHDAARH